MATPAPFTMLPNHRTWFRSGTNHAGEIRATYALGFSVGVSVAEVNEDAMVELASWANHPSRPLLFVDSGAFGEVQFDAKLGRMVDRVKVKNGKVKSCQITEADWEERLDTYERLALWYGPRCYLVAPDRVGDQQETLARMARYADRVRWLLDHGANVIVPLQRGELDIATFANRAVKALGGWHVGMVWGIPLKKQATDLVTLMQFAERLAEEFPSDVPPRFHFLGKAPASLEPHPGDDFLRALYAVKRFLPDALITCDSVQIKRLVGKTNGPGGGPRAITKAREAAVALLGKDAPVALVKDATVTAVYGAERAEADALDTKLFTGLLEIARAETARWPTGKGGVQEVEVGSVTFGLLPTAEDYR